MTTVLRPLSTGELLDRTFSLYKAHFVLFVGIIALPHLATLVFGLVSLPLRRYLGLGMFEWFFIAIGLALLVGAISQAATIVAVSEVYLGRPTGIVDSYMKVRFSLVGVILLTFVMGVACGLGAMLLVVPGFVLAMMWSLAVPAAVLEDQGIVDAMTRSADLTRGFRWRVFVIWLLFFVLTISVSFLLQWPIRIATLAAIKSHTPSTLRWLGAASTVISFFTTCLVGPLATIAFSLLYYDLRVRKEAFDLQLMMDTLDGRERPAEPSTALS
jgi:hypothetical protein